MTMEKLNNFHEIGISKIAYALTMVTNFYIYLFI